LSSPPTRRSPAGPRWRRNAWTRRRRPANGSLFEGDAEAGWLAVSLDRDDDRDEDRDEDAPDNGISMAVLIRRRPGTAAILPGWTADPLAYAHEWRDAEWEWALALWGRPLSPGELERVIASLGSP
jgi:hypothetical protein